MATGDWIVKKGIQRENESTSRPILHYTTPGDSVMQLCMHSPVYWLYRWSTLRRGFRHVQHVRPNRGPHKKGAPQARNCRRQHGPTGQRLSDASTTFSDLWGGPIYAVLRHLKHVSTECFCTLMSENLCKGRAPTFLPNRVRSGLNPALSTLSL